MEVGSRGGFDMYSVNSEYGFVFLFLLLQHFSFVLEFIFFSQYVDNGINSEYCLVFLFLLSRKKACSFTRYHITYFFIHQYIRMYSVNFKYRIVFLSTSHNVFNHLGKASSLTKLACDKN